MSGIVVLGVFVADTGYRAGRLPKIGETLLGESFQLGPGGKGSNQSIAAARLGADVTLITRLGDDDFGQMARHVWAEAGVKPQLRPGSYTGAAFVFVDSGSGDNAIIIAPGGGAEIEPSDLDAAKAQIAAASVFLTQLEQPLEAAQRGLEIARRAGVTTILNPAPAAELPSGLLALCDIVTPNETEAEALTGITVETTDDARAAAEALCAMGVRRPIITLGARGAYVHELGLVAAYDAGQVIETTGAGDAFNGALATGLAEGLALEDAAELACATAGLSVTRAGAAASMPHRREVNAILRKA